MRDERCIVFLQAVQVFNGGNVKDAESWSGIVRRSNVRRTDNGAVGKSDVVSVLELSQKWTGWDALVKALLETKRTRSSLIKTNGGSLHWT